MLHLPSRRWLASFVLGLAATISFGGRSAASKLAQSVRPLDHFIPQDKWAGAGLDKLTSSEQQTLADDITSLLATQTTVSAAPSAKDRTPWRKLQRNMTKDDVRKLLGEPNTISVSRFSESWYYPGGSVTFTSKGRLDMWTED